MAVPRNICKFYSDLVIQLETITQVRGSNSFVDICSW